MPAPITHTAANADHGMTTTEVYDFLVAITRAGIHHPVGLAAVTGAAGQLLALTTTTTTAAAEGSRGEENR